MTTLLRDVRLGSQTPRVGRWPEYSSSSGLEVVELAASAGLILDPWQTYVLVHGLGERPDGLWSSFKVSVWVPRQNGKGGIIEARELAGLFLFNEQLILHSAHEYKTAQEAFLRIRNLIESTPDLDRRVNKYWSANGEQGIELKKSAGGGRLRFIARSSGSGRGFTGNLNILDEAQALTAEQMAAILPTMSAVHNPQLWFFGTPPSDPSAWAYGLREDGEAGVPRMAHFDWGADLDMTDGDDRRRAFEDIDLWYATNPAMGRRIQEEFVIDEAKPSGLGERFLVERLGVWPPRAGDGPKVLDLASWGVMADTGSKLVGDVAFALDITPNRDYSSIAAYGLNADGVGHVEIIDRRPNTHWVVERLIELAEKWKPVAIGLDVKGPAGSLLLELEKAGIVKPEDPEKPLYGNLAIPTAQDVAAACGQFADAVQQQTLKHRDVAILNDALRGAKTRTLGDSWAWARRVPRTDISPLMAVTLARWAYETRAHIVTKPYDALANIW